MGCGCNSKKNKFKQKVEKIEINRPKDGYAHFFKKNETDSMININEISKFNISEIIKDEYFTDLLRKPKDQLSEEELRTKQDTLEFIANKIKNKRKLDLD
jgi:hypothetical protein